MNKFLIILPLILILGACSGKNLLIQVKPVTAGIIHPTLPRGTNSREIKWRVLNLELLDAIVKDAKKTGKRPVFYVLDTKGYENLAINTADLVRYIRDQKQIIIYYRTLPILNDNKPIEKKK